VLPALDEAAALPGVLAGLPTGYDAMVVDNGSTDDTAAVARAHGAEVVHEPRRGFGAACHAGLLAALAELVAFCDADGSLDLRNLPALVQLVQDERADIALGTRCPSGPGAWPLHARAANRLLARRLRRRSGMPITDLGPLRVGRREARLLLDVRDRASGWPLEQLLRAGQLGLRVAQLPVPYRPRTGRSKVTGTLSGTVRAALDMHRVMRSL
jgi:glycosyltransferase involved in cell wall biosynthesis